MKNGLKYLVIFGTIFIIFNFNSTRAASRNDFIVAAGKNSPTLEEYSNIYINSTSTEFKLSDNSIDRYQNMPQIMYWYGKVNQHLNLRTNIWETDTDGISGANIDRLLYCRKFWPRTIEVKPFRLITINSWRIRGNVGNPYASTKMSYVCIPDTEEQITLSHIHR